MNITNIVNRKALWPHIPDATETPAPVNTTIDLHSGDSMKRPRPTKSVMVLMVEVVPREGHPFSGCVLVFGVNSSTNSLRTYAVDHNS